MSKLYNPVNFTYELVEDHLKYFFKNSEKHTYLSVNEWGVKKWKYTPFIFEVTLRESFKKEHDAIYRKIKISIAQDTFYGVGSGHREEKRYVIEFHSADFCISFHVMSKWSVLASEIKNTRQKVERLQSVYAFLIERNLKDGDKKFHIDCISTPPNQEEGFVIPQDELGEVA